MKIIGPEHKTTMLGRNIYNTLPAFYVKIILERRHIIISLHEMLPFETARIIVHGGRVRMILCALPRDSRV